MKRTMLAGAALIAAVMTGFGAVAADMPRAKPEEVGLSSERLDHMDAFFAKQVADGKLAGVVTLVARHGKVAHLDAVGYADIEHKTRMQADSIFRLYSMTKPIASTALMMLYEEGRFQMTDPVSKYIPEFAKLRVLRTPDSPVNDTVEMEHQPVIEDLFRHTAGFSHGLLPGKLDDLYVKADVFGVDVTLKEMMTRLAGIPLHRQPRTAFEYSVGPDVIARLVEIISGMPFDEFLEKRLFQPLSMKDTGFWLPENKAKRLATLYWAKDGVLTPLDEAHGHPDGGILVQPWSVNSYTVNHKHKGGSVGLVSSIEDYWRFAQMMSNGGTLDGVRILSPETVRYMARDHMAKIGPFSPGIGFGLGFAVIKDPGAVGYITSEGNYYWGGAAATQFLIDPKNDMVAVIMTQHMSVPAVGNLVGEFHAMVYGALMQ